MTTARHVQEKVGLRRQIFGCQNCDLRVGCHAPVPFAGPTPNRLMVVGEAPGADEDKQGEPFVGKSGKLLRRLIREVGMDDKKMAWANTVCCYPHGTPKATHVEACRYNLRRQMELVDPFHVLLVGGVALGSFRPDLRISQVHGRLFVLSKNGPVCFPILHPAAALREPTWVPKIRNDLRVWKSITEAFTPWEHFPIICSVCDGWVDHYDPDGMAWCKQHWGQGQEGWEQARRWRDRKTKLPKLAVVQEAML